jgi:integrase/recombinase XerC
MQRGREAGEGAVERPVELHAALAQVFGAGVRPLHFEQALLDAVLQGWQNQMSSRNLTPRTKSGRLGLVRRAVREIGVWPWEWRAIHVEEWMDDLVLRQLALATRRNYQIVLRLFLEFLLDRRYPWEVICREELGALPVQVFDDANLIRHLHDYEADPAKRPLGRAEVDDFLAYCDAQVFERQRRGRKGWLTAFRDATIFKTLYAFGLRRQEVVWLDVGDVYRNAEVPAFGSYGLLSVRYGKGGNGSGPKRRDVLTVFDWSVEVLEQWREEVRPRYGFDELAAMFPTERGRRVSVDYVSHRFAEYRDAVGLDARLTAHCLRHSYVTHLTEDGLSPLFIQMQAGHEYASTTAIYTGVSDDFKVKLLTDYLERELTKGA